MTSIAYPDDIRRELSVLASRVEAVERQLAGPPNGRPAGFNLAGLMAEVREITEEIFPGKCEFTSEVDPEYPEDRYVVVNVEASGSPQEIVDRSCQWDERIRALSADLVGVLRLWIATC